MPTLDGKIALVTGASRGIGKGIAHAVGAAGATVYITGRLVHAGAMTVHLPGPIHETVALVNEADGIGTLALWRGLGSLSAIPELR